MTAAPVSEEMIQAALRVYRDVGHLTVSAIQVALGIRWTNARRVYDATRARFPEIPRRVLCQKNPLHTEEKVEAAIRHYRDTGQLSISSIQVALSVGYATAKRIYETVRARLPGVPRNLLHGSKFQYILGKKQHDFLVSMAEMLTRETKQDIGPEDALKYLINLYSNKESATVSTGGRHGSTRHQSKGPGPEARNRKGAASRF